MTDDKFFKLSDAALKNVVKNTTIGRKLHFYDTVTSTFDKLCELPVSEGLTVVAAHQTNGRGRLGRSWDSDRGGIYFSFILLPTVDADSAPFITLICALAVQKALCEYLPCEIKWPNDIVSDGKKLCGILTKTTLCGDRIENILVGIGINANNTRFPKELVNASSLKLATGRDIDENRLLSKVLRQLDRYYYNESREKVLDEYKKVCANSGKKVTIHYADGRGDIDGICTDILPDGTMNVLTDSGIINVSSGEVSVKGIYESERTI